MFRKIGQGREVLGRMGNTWGLSFLSRPVPETAIVTPEAVFILLGDFRNEFEAIVGGGGSLFECFRFYDTHRADQSNLSPVVPSREERVSALLGVLAEICLGALQNPALAPVRSHVALTEAGLMELIEEAGRVHE